MAIRTKPAKSAYSPREAQVLMAWPFFSLSKSRRTRPISLDMGPTRILVEPDGELGIATIWDADILTWMITSIVEATDIRACCSPLMITPPRQILTFSGRGTGQASYDRLRAALARLAQTRITATIHQRAPWPDLDWSEPFSWISRWGERFDDRGRSTGIELEMSQQLFALVQDPRQVLTINPRYFALTGGIERWLYRIVRKHGGRQTNGWSFELDHLHLKSGSLASRRRFAFEIRAIVRRQALPGYVLGLEHDRLGQRLRFCPVRSGTLPIDRRPIQRRSGEKL